MMTDDSSKGDLIGLVCLAISSLFPILDDWASELISHIVNPFQMIDVIYYFIFYHLFSNVEHYFSEA